MKLKLIKCLICGHWRMKRDADHCPICNAARVRIGLNGPLTHINVATGKEIVRGVYSYSRIAEMPLAVARILGE